MKKEIEVFKEHLKKQGLKYTPERQEIVDGIFDLHRHFDVDELYDFLKSKGKNISRATIYRTIPLLVESMLVQETVGNQDKIRYEHVFGHDHHDHMVCVDCGKVIEFKDETIEELQNEVCKKFDFQPLDHKLGIKGYCSKCQSKSK